VCARCVLQCLMCTSNECKNLFEPFRSLTQCGKKGLPSMPSCVMFLSCEYHELHPGTLIGGTTIACCTGNIGRESLQKTMCVVATCLTHTR